MDKGRGFLFDSRDSAPTYESEMGAFSPPDTNLKDEGWKKSSRSLRYVKVKVFGSAEAAVTLQPCSFSNSSTLAVVVLACALSLRMSLLLTFQY